MHFRYFGAASVAVGAALLFAGAAQAGQPAHFVYTETNSTDGNVVEILAGAQQGSVYQLDSVPTGGTGTSAGLGSQGAVAPSDKRRGPLAVHARSQDRAPFRRGRPP